MKLHHLPIPLLCLAVLSCDKAKNIAGKARTAVESEIAKQSGKSAENKPDSEWQKLVDQTPEGVIFRKDLPFPTKLEVKTTRLQEVSQRIVQSSAIENQKLTVKGTRTMVTKLERDGDQVRYSLLEFTFSEPVTGPADDKKPVATPLAPPSKPVVFLKTGTTWKADSKEGFRAVALSKTLSPVFEDLLVENALAPHALWFGKKRFKIGDQLTVPESSLPMLVTGNAKGTLTLTLKSFDAVKGHPCGVFEVRGKYDRKQSPDFEGGLTDEDVTIQSGQLWLSLIYPLVLKEELDTIQSTRTGGQGNAASRSQGGVKVSVTREWKQL
ncbi:MAG: hypothetical protein V4819_12350 [Verrucomicrobiota bacterium]